MSRDEYIHTVNPCYCCECYDPDYESCTMPDTDHIYACRQHTEEFRIKDFYYNNQDFRAYVDKYARDRGISAEEALTHELVKEVYLHYREEANNGTS